MTTQITYNEASALSAQSFDEILFGAGTYRENMVLDEEAGTLTAQGDIVGITDGGGKFSIKPNIVPLSLDQSNVSREGAYVKDGEVATIEANPTQLRAVDVTRAVVGEAAEGTGCKVIKSSEAITTGHYYKGFGFVGRTATGKPVIVFFKTALCTSGLEVSPKKSSQGTPTIAWECVADVDSGKNVLPYTIIWPSAATAAAASAEEGAE